MKRVLVVDDNEDTLEMMTEILSYENFEVQGARAAGGLFKLIASFKPDLVLLDYRLPDGHGGELCLQLKTHPELSYIPVIIFTAYQQPAEDFSIYRPDMVIHKPFDLEDLIGRVTALLSLKAHSS